MARHVLPLGSILLSGFFGLILHGFGRAGSLTHKAILLEFKITVWEKCAIFQITYLKILHWLLIDVEMLPHDDCAKRKLCCSLVIEGKISIFEEYLLAYIASSSTTAENYRKFSKKQILVSRNVIMAANTFTHIFTNQSSIQIRICTQISFSRNSLQHDSVFDNFKHLIRFFLLYLEERNAIGPNFFTFFFS